MTSQVLYRKWRPQRLDEVVGQTPITQTLRYALATGRVAHAYLFCGPRGTGKTSTARILGKTVNCLEPQDGEPCNRCILCRDVIAGQSLDLIEMDAASNRGIDEIRNLRERVHHSPTQGKYKTYIIDEVHMLTEFAFNALLKTLEEPPPHAIFVLATTDPQKVPPTVISRCQRFDFRRISPGDTIQRLAQVCKAEGVEAEELALEVIARSAWGSLRDAENILEQAIISHGSPIQAAQVRELLGIGDDETALKAAAHALEGDVQGGLLAINLAASEGLDLRHFHRSLVEYLRALLLLKSGFETPLDYPGPILEEMRRLASTHPLARIYQVLKTFAQVNLRQDNPSPLNLELALVECALAEEETSLPTEQTTKRRPEPPPPPQPPQPQPTASSPPPQAIAREAPEDSSYETAAVTSPGPGSASEPAEASEQQWSALIKSLKGQKGKRMKRFSLDGLLNNAETRRIADNALVLGYRHPAHRDWLQDELADPQMRIMLEGAVEKALGVSTIKPELIEGAQGQSSKKAAQGHLVRAAQQLGGRVIEEQVIDETGEEA